MTIEGWVAISRYGLILGTFRESQDDAADAAWRILRLLGGQQLVAGFRLVRATLVVDETTDDDAGERQCIPIGEGRRPGGIAPVPA